MTDLFSYILLGMIGMAALVFIALIAFVIRRIMLIETIEELNVHFPKDMSKADRRTLLFDAVSHKTKQLKTRYSPDKVCVHEAYFFRNGKEEPFSDCEIESLDRTDFVHIQYITS